MCLLSTTLPSFPDSSVGKESVYNAGGPGSIPGSGRSPGEGIGYPLQYSWASLVAQLVKNMPAMLETWVRSLGWEDALEKEGKVYPLQYSGLENSMDCIVHGVTKSQTRLSDFHFHHPWSSVLSPGLSAHVHNLEVGTIRLCILQVRKLRVTEEAFHATVNGSVQIHTVC